LEYVTVAQAARILGLSEATIRGRIREGLWPSYRLGERSYRLDLDEIKKLTKAAIKTKQDKDVE